MKISFTGELARVWAEAFMPEPDYCYNDPCDNEIGTSAKGKFIVGEREFCSAFCRNLFRQEAAEYGIEL